MDSLAFIALSSLAACLLVPTVYLVYLTFIWPLRNPIRKLPGPPGNRFLELGHMSLTMECVASTVLVSQTLVQGPANLVQTTADVIFHFIFECYLLQESNIRPALSVLLTAHRRTMFMQC